MSGHSKWATIKHKKGALDAKRGKIFTRLIKEITMAAKSGGDPEKNPRLRTAVAAAKAENMPADNIKRAIQRGTGELPGVTYEEITFEGYGPGGVAILVEVSTDNRNRTVSEIRHAFSKNGGNLGAAGSVAYMFHKKGDIVIAKSAVPAVLFGGTSLSPARLAEKRSVCELTTGAASRFAITAAIAQNRIFLVFIITFLRFEARSATVVLSRQPTLVSVPEK